MKKNIYTTSKTLILALIIGVGTAIAFGATWFEPGVVPAGNNVDSPINTSMSVQTKSGGLNIIHDVDEPKLMPDILSVFGTTYLAGDVKVGDPLSGTSTNNMYITGKLGINLDATAVVTPPATQTIDVNGQARFSDLAKLPDNGGIDYPAPVCISTSGTLILCPLPDALTAFLTNIVATVTNQDVFVDAIENNNDDYNCSADVSFSGGSTGGEPDISYSWKVRNNSGAPFVSVVYPVDVDHTPFYAGVNAEGNVWVNVGTDVGTTTFTVWEKNPHLLNRDDWTIQLTATDADGATSIVSQDFDVWSIAECKD